MADNTIPPVFRDALDEPAPPEPPEIEPERDDDDGGRHVHVQPRVIVFSDGAVSTSGLIGSVLVGWFHVASFVTFCVALWATWQWIGYLGWGGFRAGLIGGAITAGLVLTVLWTIGVAIFQPTRLRRVSPAICLAVGAGLLGWVIDRWWMS